jgi:hypothetical protein
VEFILMLLMGAAFVAVAVWQSADVLSLFLSSPDAEDTRSRLDVVTGILLVMPVLAIGLLAAVILIILQDSIVTRFAHAFLLLGMWMSAALSVLALPISVRQHEPSILALAGVVLTVPAAVYLTPLSHLVNALPEDGTAWPFAIGLALVAVCYAALFRVRISLSVPSRSSQVPSRSPEGSGS